MRTKRTIPAHRREPRMALRPKRPPSPASGDDVTGHDVLHPSEFIAPCLPTISRVVPVGPQWAYEIKHDGFRFLAVREAKHGKCGSKDVDVRPNWREQPGMPDRAPGLGRVMPARDWINARSRRLSCRAWERRVSNCAR